MNKVRYFYRNERDLNDVNRWFTVAYRYDPDTGNLDYGASVYRQDKANESFHKRDHRATAEARLKIRPVRLSVPVGLTYEEVEDVARISIMHCGVRGPRHTSSEVLLAERRKQLDSL